MIGYKERKQNAMECIEPRIALRKQIIVFFCEESKVRYDRRTEALLWPVM